MWIYIQCDVMHLWLIAGVSRHLCLFDGVAKYLAILVNFFSYVFNATFVPLTDLKNLT